MKIVGCVKWAGSLSDDIEFDDAGNVDRDYLDYALNEWDAFAVAEALRLRDEAGTGEVVVLTVGDEEADEALVECLAMGADRAVRIAPSDTATYDPMTIAHLLAPVVKREEPDLVLCGAQSADASQGATAGALAGLLELPCAAVVSAVDAHSQPGAAVVHRELEGGALDVVEVQMPAVLSIQTGICELRYLTMRAIQQAKQLEVEVVECAPPESSGYRIRRMFVPERTLAELIEGGAPVVAETIARLIEEVRQ